MTALDPEIAAFVAQLTADWRAHPPLDTLPMPEARAVAERVRARWAAGGPAMAASSERVIALPGGPLRARVHRPAGAPETNAPALLYLHGGGFVTFSLDTHDRLMREYAAAGGFVVVGVDYPLSPEVRHPVALDQVVALVRWLEQGAVELGLDPARLAIGGDSAGANLSLATCLKLRDEGEPDRLRAILSNYGAFSGEVSDAAEAAHGGPDAILTQAEMRAYFALYLATPGQTRSPYAVPLDAADLSRLPPIFFVMPECDVLAEQSITLAERMAAAGGAVTSKVYRGATHSFLEAMSVAAVAREAIADGAAWLRQQLG